MNRLKEFLDENYVKYINIVHSRAYTAQEIAEVSHIPGQNLAKTVIVKIDGKFAMVVLPAKDHISFAHLRQTLGALAVDLAMEEEFQGRFPGCEVGAMPPFGNLYDMPVYVSRSLTHDKRIAFNAGTHTELIELSYNDFARLVKPIVIDL